MPLMSMPRIRPATASASAASLASFTPPALPRPPTSTWALMTTASAPSANARSAAPRASAGVRATSHAGTGRPWVTRRDLASASWIFTLAPEWDGSRGSDGLAASAGSVRGSVGPRALVGVGIGTAPSYRATRPPAEHPAGRPPLVRRGRPVGFGHAPPCHPHPRGRHRAGDRGGRPIGPRGDGDRLRVARRRRRRGRHGRVRDAAPGPRPRVDPARQGRPEGTHHDAGRGGLPERERRPPPGPGAVRQRPPGAFDEGPRHALRERGPRDRPREHRGPVRRHRAHGRARRRGEHQDHHPGGIGADRPLRLRLRARQRPAQGDRRPQGEHHEALGRPVPGVVPRRRGTYEGRASSSRTASSTTCACSSSRSRSSTTCSSCRTSTATS